VRQVRMVLCPDCGRVMKRYVSKCDRCTRTNLEFFSDYSADRFKVRVEEVTGKSAERNHPLKSALIVLAVAAVVTMIGYDHLPHKRQVAQKPVATAAAPSAVVH
jgi:hypothetical protein